jgi:hypothetical protein
MSDKITINQSDFEALLESLQATLDLCNHVDYCRDAEVENSPPYIVGWTKSSLMCLIEQLQTYKKLNEVSDNV